MLDAFNDGFVSRMLERGITKEAAVQALNQVYAETECLEKQAVRGDRVSAMLEQAMLHGTPGKRLAAGRIATGPFNGTMSLGAMMPAGKRLEAVTSVDGFKPLLPGFDNSLHGTLASGFGIHGGLGNLFNGIRHDTSIPKITTADRMRHKLNMFNRG